MLLFGNVRGQRRTASDAKPARRVLLGGRARRAAGQRATELWWLDPLAAFVMAGVAVREDLEAWRGEGCYDE
jgi:hypothetical protein